MCAVYVDDMFRYPAGQFRGMKMSHMIADTEEELHAMANKIGIQRKWAQHVNTPGLHYDISYSKRELAIQFGALSISWRTLSLMISNRRRGLPLGDPSKAYEVFMKHVELDRKKRIGAEDEKPNKAILSVRRPPRRRLKR